MARFTGAPPRTGAKLYFTDFDIRSNAIEVTSFGDKWGQYINGQPEITFSGVMTNTEGSYAIMRALLNGGGIDFMQERHEWMCTWCASPNPIEHRHCSQCGGPRGWIL